jgi:hypothetical protein
MIPVESPTVANPYHYADNDPVDKSDPSGLRAGDGGITDGEVGAACDAEGGRILAYGDTGVKTCLEPPTSHRDGDHCFPMRSPSGKSIVYHQGRCQYQTTEVTCARGEWIPGLKDPTGTTGGCPLGVEN